MDKDACRGERQQQRGMVTADLLGSDVGGLVMVSDGVVGRIEEGRARTGQAAMDEFRSRVQDKAPEEQQGIAQLNFQEFIRNGADQDPNTRARPLVKSCSAFNIRSSGNPNSWYVGNSLGKRDPTPPRPRDLWHLHKASEI